MTSEQKAALDLAVLNLKTHGDDQLLSAVTPLIDFYETSGKQKPVATIRVAHGGYGMELSTYIAYALPEGKHDLYARPLVPCLHTYLRNDAENIAVCQGCGARFDLRGKV